MCEVLQPAPSSSVHLCHPPPSPLASESPTHTTAASGSQVHFAFHELNCRCDMTRGAIVHNHLFSLFLQSLSFGYFLFFSFLSLLLVLSFPLGPERSNQALGVSVRGRLRVTGSPLCVVLSSGPHASTPTFPSSLEILSQDVAAC